MELNALSGEIVLLFKVYIAVWLAFVEPATLSAFEVANTPLLIFDLFFLFVVSLTPVRFWLVYLCTYSPRVGYGLAIFNVSRVVLPKQEGIGKLGS